MNKELRRCPFCGGEGELWDNKLERRLYGVICKECDCMTPYFITEEESIEAWNRREPMDRIVEQLENASCYIEDGDGHAGHLVFTDEAIEIVKGGAV